jgi:hypothetical protein
MDYLLRVPVALVGLLFVRAFLYPRGWGKRSIGSALFAVIGVGLVFPLAGYSPTGSVLALGGSVALLLPYRSLAVRYMKARTRAALRALAGRWNTVLDEDARNGRWDVVREDRGRKTWVGNVLTHQGSVDPGVRRKQVGYMLAFVRELAEEPPFQCSLMIGWEKPRYFEREWRATHVIQGEFLSLAFGEIGLTQDRGRATGGIVSRLRPLDPPAGAPPNLQMLGTNPAEFARIFTPELVQELSRVARRTHPWELNVTPSSLSIYTTYCDREALDANLELVEKIGSRLST